MDKAWGKTGLHLIHERGISLNCSLRDLNKVCNSRILNTSVSVDKSHDAKSESHKGDTCNINPIKSPKHAQQSKEKINKVFHENNWNDTIKRKKSKDKIKDNRGWIGITKQKEPKTKQNNGSKNMTKSADNSVSPNQTRNNKTNTHITKTKNAVSSTSWSPINQKKKLTNSTNLNTHTQNNKSSEMMNINETRNLKKTRKQVTPQKPKNCEQRKAVSKSPESCKANNVQIKKSIPSNCVIQPPKSTSGENVSLTIQAWYYALNSNYLSTPERVKIILSIKPLFMLYPSKKTLGMELITYYEKAYLFGSNFLKKYNMNVINKKFIPSKTAINGWNFITKDEEERLISKQQPQEVINLFRLIMLLLNKDYDLIGSDKIIKYFFRNIFTTYNVTTLMNKVSELTEEQVTKMALLYQQNSNMWDVNELAKAERNLTYMTFIWKEIFAYTFMKTEDGKSYRLIKTKQEELRRVKERIERLKKENSDKERG